ncbi:MAG: heme biosynthesis protein HemY [Candidatus Competibacterales bacterium]
MVRFFVELLVLVAVLLLAIPAAQYLLTDPGYVLVYLTQEQQFETNIPAFVALVALAALVLHWLIWLVTTLAVAPARVLGNRRQRDATLAQQELNRGAHQLIEGHWDAAERHLSRSSAIAANPFAGLSHAKAAEAAERQGADWRRDDYLRRAARLPREQARVAALTRAELLLERGEANRARDLLISLQRLEPRQPRVLGLLAESLHQLGEWRALLRLLGELKRSGALPPEAFNRYQRDAYFAVLSQLGREGDARVVRRFFDEAVPKTWRQDPALLAHFARQLARAGDAEDAERLLRRALGRGLWSDDLIGAYGELQHDAAGQYELVEALRERHADSPSLLLALGRLAKRTQQLEKAKAFLQDSVRLKPEPEAYRELGETLEALRDWETASKAYRRGLMLTGQGDDGSATPVAAAVAS